MFCVIYSRPKPNHPACRPVAEAVRGYSRFTGEPRPSPPLLTWDIHHVKAVPSDLDMEPPCRCIGIYTVARLSLVWFAHTGKTVLSLPPMVMSPIQSNPQVPAFPNASPLRKPALPSLDSASTDQSTPHQSPWPLVIFSHGLGGGETTYRFCARASIVCFDNCSLLQ